MNTTNHEERSKHPEVDAVIGEIMDLLMVQWVYHSHIKYEFPNPHKSSREAIYRWLFNARIIENDMVLRICRLDDDDRSQHSFREALKAVRTLIPQKEVQALDNRLKQYRRLINPLKTKARNYDLAHLAKGAQTSLDPRFDLSPLVKEAVGILDAIRGEAPNYAFRPSKHDPVIYLRDYITKPQPAPAWSKALSSTT